MPGECNAGLKPTAVHVGSLSIPDHARVLSSRKRIVGDEEGVCTETEQVGSRHGVKGEQGDTMDSSVAGIIIGGGESEGAKGESLMSDGGGNGIVAQS